MSVRRVRRVVVQQGRDRARLRRAHPGFLIDAQRFRAAPSYCRELGIARSLVFGRTAEARCEGALMFEARSGVMGCAGALIALALIAGSARASQLIVAARVADGTGAPRCRADRRRPYH